jgi:hypothetical protein
MNRTSARASSFLVIAVMSGSAGVGEEDRFDPVREEIRRRLVQ